MILLDTHVVLWLRYGDARLGRNARAEIDLAWESDQLGLSAITFWELAMLREKGRISFPENVGLWRQEQLRQNSSRPRRNQGRRTSQLRERR